MGNKQAAEEFNIDNSLEGFEDIEDFGKDYIECPEFTLEKAQNLNVLMQKQITWMLVQFKPKGDPLTEEVEGFLKVYKKNRYGIKEMRWMLFTTIALYLVEPKNFLQVNSRFLLADIRNLGYSLDNKAFGFNVPNEENPAQMFYYTDSISPVNAIKTLYYLLKEEFIYINIADSPRDLEKSLEILIGPDEPEVEAFKKLKEKFGTLGEYLITTVNLFEMLPKIKKVKMHISNFNLFIASSNGKLLNLIPLSEIFGCYMLMNHLEFVIKSRSGDIWLVHDQAYAILKEITEIITSEYHRKIRIRVLDKEEIRFASKKRF